MADGLSIAAGIIAVIQLTEKLTSWGCGYIGGVKRAAKDRNELLDELSSLMTVLIALEDYADTNPQSPTLQKLNNQQGINGFIAELDTLKAKLEPRKGLMTMMDKLRWPFGDNEIAQFRLRMNSYKTLFNIALAADTSRGVQDIRTELAATRQGEEVLRRGVKRKEVFNWVFSEDFEKRHTEISNQRQKDTGTWLLQAPEFQGWEDGDPNFSLLWGFGIPGAGKTFLSSMVIDHFQDQKATKRLGVAYVYFEYTERDQQKPLHVISSLVKQLAAQTADLPAEVEELYNRLGGSGRRPKLEELYTALIATFRSFSTVFLVFDALDECEQESQRKVLLPLFHKLGKGGARLFVTSRQYPEDIQESFQNSAKIELSAKQEDIEVYIQQRIDEKPNAKRLIHRAKCHDRIISELKDCAHGMFLLVRFHIEHLCQQTTGKQLLSALDRLRNSSTSERPLDPTYDRAMVTLRNQPKGRADLGERILLWLVKARRTLVVKEIQVAVSVEAGRYELDELDLPDRATMLDVCAGLVTIDENKTIRLAHYTVQEYLLENSHLPEDAEFSLAMACTTFLSFDAFAQGPCKSQESYRARLELYPFINYAAHHIQHHIQLCDRGSLTDIFLKFLGHVGSVASYLQVLQDKYWQRFDRYTWEYLPLHLASSFGHLEAVRTLLDRGADISIQDNNGRTALLRAVAGGHDTVVGLLLDRGADISIQGNDRRTVLHEAAAFGHDAVVGVLLDRGADISIQDIDGWTALLWAAACGHDTVVGLLLDRGADISIQDKYGRTALLQAAAFGYDTIVRLLLDRGANISIQNNGGETALLRAAAFGHDTVVGLLLDRGADISIQGNDRRTALHEAAAFGHDAVVELLLDRGADISIQDRNGRTALLDLAAADGDDTVARLLLEKGISLSTLNIIEGTASQPAKIDRREALARLFLEKGADILVQGTYGQVALLHLAAANGNEAVVRLLLERGVNISTQNNNGQTALHQAVAHGKEDMVKLLLEKDADVSIKDHTGYTALHWAAGSRKGSLVRLLFESVAKPTAKGNGGPLLTQPELDIDAAVQQMLVENGVSSSTIGELADTAPRQTVILPYATRKRIFCDSCDIYVPDLYYHCVICGEGDYDLCWNCVKLGAHCKESTHYLFLVKKYDI